MHQVRRISRRNHGKHAFGLPPVTANGQSVSRHDEEVGDKRVAQGRTPAFPGEADTEAGLSQLDDTKHHGAARTSGSAVALLLQARRSLERSFSPLGMAADFPTRVGGIGLMIARACAISQEVALATALLQVSGRYSIRHSVNVAVTCQIVGPIIELDERELASIVSAALTMNISMLDLQDTLHAQHRPLTELQRGVIKVHPQKSEALLRSLGVEDELWLNAVRQHHDALDGSTSGQSGEADGKRTRAAELIALADVYCARISARTDRRASGPSAVLKSFLRAEADGGSTGLASCLIKALGVFPPGTPVRLANGEIAVVTERGDNPGTPRVYSVVDAAGMPRLVPVKRDTDNPQFGVREVLEWSTVGSLPSMESLWGRIAAEN